MRAPVLIVLFLGALAAPAAAELRVDGPEPFRNHVYLCLERFSGGPPETRDILRALQAPAGTGKRNTIRSGPLPAGVVGLTSGGTQGLLQPGRVPGSGSNAHVTIDNTLPLDDELCAILIHELKHAADFNAGTASRTQPARPDPSHGILHPDIDAMREENRYRKHAGLPQATTYGSIPLPADAMF